MLVVLLESDFDKSVKLVGIELITSKKGDYLAQKIFDILTSKDLYLIFLNLFSKLSCHLYGENFKLRWDILHLTNRAHLDALDSHLEIKELMGFIQTHSSAMRSGLDYTSLFISDLIGFKRPKKRSETRMVNYEFDQFDRFLNNSKYFDHPESIVLTALMYVVITLSTKIMLQEAQKTSYTSDFIDFMFVKEGGKNIMFNLLNVFKS